MQHNLEDGMDGERQGWAKAGPGAEGLSGFPGSPGAGRAAGTAGMWQGQPSPGQGPRTFLSISLAAQRFQPSRFCLEPHLDKICQLSTHRTRQRFPLVEVYSRTIPGME